MSGKKCTLSVKLPVVLGEEIRTLGSTFVLVCVYLSVPDCIAYDFNVTGPLCVHLHVRVHACAHVWFSMSYVVRPVHASFFVSHA